MFLQASLLLLQLVFAASREAATFLSFFLLLLQAGLDACDHLAGYQKELFCLDDRQSTEFASLLEKVSQLTPFHTLSALCLHRGKLVPCRRSPLPQTRKMLRQKNPRKKTSRVRSARKEKYWGLLNAKGRRKENGNVTVFLT